MHISFVQNVQKVRHGIDHKAIRLQLQKGELWNIGTNKAEKLLAEWMGNRNYEKIKLGNPIPKSRLCNTLITALPLSHQILMLSDVSHKYVIPPVFFNSLQTSQFFVIPA